MSRQNTDTSDLTSKEEQEHLQDFMGDIGNFELPDLDLNLMDFIPSDETEETRYTLPKVVPMKEDFVLYDNAQKMAKELRLGFGERFDAFVSGSFIFGDFIEVIPHDTDGMCQEDDNKHPVHEPGKCGQFADTHGEGIH